VAVFATVLETFYGDNQKMSLRWAQLKAETAPSDPRPSQYGRWDDNWDQRQPAKDRDLNNKTSGGGQQRSSASRTLILIRHGQYELAGKTDEERILTSLGRSQADMTGARLAELSLPYTHIIRSNMSRAVETADLISAHLPEVKLLPTDGILREGAPITPEPRQKSWRPEVNCWTDGPRIEAAFRKYFHRAEPTQTENSYEIMVCHANVIRYFVCRALQLPPEAWLRISLKHASLTILTIGSSGRVSLRCLGEAGHLKPEMLTTS